MTDQPEFTTMLQDHVHEFERYKSLALTTERQINELSRILAAILHANGGNITVSDTAWQEHYLNKTEFAPWQIGICPSGGRLIKSVKRSPGRKPLARD